MLWNIIVEGLTKLSVIHRDIKIGDFKERFGFKEKGHFVGDFEYRNLLLSESARKIEAKVRGNEDKLEETVDALMKESETENAKFLRKRLFVNKVSHKMNKTMAVSAAILGTLLVTVFFAIYTIVAANKHTHRRLLPRPLVSSLYLVSSRLRLFGPVYCKNSDMSKNRLMISCFFTLIGSTCITPLLLAIANVSKHWIMVLGYIVLVAFSIGAMLFVYKYYF